MFEKEIHFIKRLFGNKQEISLHEPCFIGNEKKYLNECIDSGFVSSVGEFVSRFEEKIKQITHSSFVTATNSGTSALHLALLASGVDKDCEVLTQSLSFVATANAIAYTGARPIFLDVDKKRLSLDALALQNFLERNTYQEDGKTLNKVTKKQIKACVLMHTFGLSADLDPILELCRAHRILLIEDAAEALGSTYRNKHLGTFGHCGILSFNGNKIVTGGCGGALLTDNENLSRIAKHLGTTGKLAHPYEYDHDLVAYNYRLCNINAALLLAQLENLELFLEDKRELAKTYREFFKDNDKMSFVDENAGERSNFWLNAVFLKEEKLREIFIKECFENRVFVRPVWKSLPSLKPYRDCQRDTLKNTKDLERCLVNLPSSVRLR